MAFAVAARVLLASAPISITTDLAQPLPVATTWHAFGRTLWFFAFAAILCANIPYLATIQGILRGHKMPGIPVIAGICALSLGAALCMPVLFSSDVYAYAAYGWFAAHSISPYMHAAVSVHDPLIRAAVWQWGNPLPICVYGPLFVWIAKVAVVGAAGFGAWGQLLALRIISSAALLACGPLVYLAFRGLRTEHRLAAAAGICLNPVVIWAAAEGHNDALMLVAVLLGFIAVRRFGYFVGALLIAASALIKASGAAAAAVLAMFAWPNRPRVFSVLGGFAVGIALTALIARPFESGVRTVLIPHGHYTPQFSAQYIFAQFIGALFGNRAHAIELGIAIAAVASLLMMLHGVRLALRKDRAGAAYIALGFWLLIPNPYPWYALWILPIAFLCIRTPAAWAIIAASLTIFIRYLPDVSAANVTDANLVITICGLGLPFAILAARMETNAPLAAFLRYALNLHRHPHGGTSRSSSGLPPSSGSLR